jgi:dimeric dUTPase (all-alpha-NTP-PPase superfamily)
MIWTSYPILYSQIDEILHDLDELFLFSSNSKTQTLFDHFVVFYKKIRVSDKNMHKNLSEGGCEN